MAPLPPLPTPPPILLSNFSITGPAYPLLWHTVPAMTDISYRETSFPIPRWYQSLSRVISHCVTNVTTSWSSSNFCSLRVCFGAAIRWQSLCAKFPRYNRSQFRFFSYGIRGQQIHFFTWCRILNRQDDNIKNDLQEVWWGGMDWIAVAQDKDRWRALVNVVMNIRVQ